MSSSDGTRSANADPGVDAPQEWAWQLVNSVTDYALFMLDPRGNIQTWNPGAQRLKGYAAHEIIGKNFTVFYPPEDVAAGKCARELEDAIRDGAVEDEGWRLRKDGSRFWANVTITAVRNPDGSLRGFAKVTRDMTRRREAEEALRLSEERFRLLVEGVHDYAIFMLDVNGRVITWNPGAERINGYRADEIIGSHFSRFYPREEVDGGKCEFELAESLKHGRFEDESLRVRKDGSTYWANVVISTIRDSHGRHIGFSKVTRDLTERRKLEAERLRLAQAEEAIRLRDEFLSIASHELKTPLTALQLQLDGLRERIASEDQKVAARLERATKSAARLADLIEALLDVSRIASGRFELHPRPTELGAVVTETVERLREAAVRAGCTIDVEVAQPVNGCWDPLRVEQVVSNLLANSLKYGATAPINLKVGQDGDAAKLVVRDHGIGIPEADLPRIFGRFERAVSLRNYGGLGLGLYVVGQIVQAHGGSVTAENAPDGGAVFTVRLPISPPPSPTAQENR